MCPAARRGARAPAAPSLGGKVRAHSGRVSICAALCNNVYHDLHVSYGASREETCVCVNCDPLYNGCLKFPRACWLPPSIPKPPTDCRSRRRRQNGRGGAQQATSHCVHRAGLTGPLLRWGSAGACPWRDGTRERPLGDRSGPSCMACASATRVLLASPRGRLRDTLECRAVLKLAGGVGARRTRTSAEIVVGRSPRLLMRCAIELTAAWLARKLSSSLACNCSRSTSFSWL